MSNNETNPRLIRFTTSTYVRNADNLDDVLGIIQKAEDLHVAEAVSKEDGHIKNLAAFYDFLFHPTHGPFRGYSRPSKRPNKWALKTFINICKFASKDFEETPPSSRTILQIRSMSWLEEHETQLLTHSNNKAEENARKRRRSQAMDDACNDVLNLQYADSVNDLQEVRRGLGDSSLNRRGREDVLDEDEDGAFDLDNLDSLDEIDDELMAIMNDNDVEPNRNNNRVGVVSPTSQAGNLRGRGQSAKI